MKRIFCSLLAVLLLCGCMDSTAPSSEPVSERIDPAEPTDAPAAVDESAASPDFADLGVTGYGGFSDLLAARLIDGTENHNLSPISVYLALAMAADGAKGDTQAAMLHLLGCESIEALRAVCGAMLRELSNDTEESSLALANAIWMAGQDGAVQFNEAYLASLANIYRAEANVVDFGKEETGKQIANWITEHTRGKIKVSEDALRFHPETLAVLINTIYLKDVWCDPFYEDATEADVFYGLEGESTVDYMKRRDTNVTIVQGDGFLRYSLPLRHTGHMTFILPDDGIAFSDLLGTPERLHALLHDGEEIRANVNVKLPKFRFQDRFDLNDALQSLGIGIAFSCNADFSGIGDFDAYISKVLQESFIGVDENGVEAAAYTMVSFDTMAISPPKELPEIDFFLTRPFLYVIEANDGTVLFIGSVTAPTASE